MTRTSYLLALVGVVSLGASTASAKFLHHQVDLDAVNRRLAGHIDDYTHNHGTDRRIWSTALCQPRDMYVYTPPGFNPCQAYPVILWLHGFLGDEQTFADTVVFWIEDAILCGQLPPVIVAAPDGSITGKASLANAGSFYVNSKAGHFEDYVIQDVWPFVLGHYPIRPEREAHVIAGESMGGFGAYNLAMKYPGLFKDVVGVFPPLNLRWVDCHGRYMGNFDPCCWGWRSELDRPREVIGRFYGVLTVRLRKLVGPLFGFGPEALTSVSWENPIEMVDRLGLVNGVLDMFVAYGGKDEYNIDAQVESFLYYTRQRGICVDVAYDPYGRHNLKTARKLFPCIVRWLGPRLAPYAPSNCGAESPPVATGGIRVS